MPRTRNSQNDTPEPTTPLPTFEASFLSTPIVTAQNEAVKAAAQPKNKRSPAQLALDGIVPQIHEAWVKAGKPSAFGKLPTVSYPVAPEGAAKLRTMIRKAADVQEPQKMRARFGQDVTITPDMAVTMGLDPEADAGKTLVTFAIMDKATRAGSGEEDEDQENDGSDVQEDQSEE